MKSRRWIAAAALAAAAVFLVMVTGESAPAPPAPEPAPVSSSEAVLAADGGPPADDTADGTGNGGSQADRDEVVEALEGLLDALGIPASELDACAGTDGSDGDGSKDAECDDRGGADIDPTSRATITITGFAFGQPLTVSPGATVEVLNSDAATHNVTATDGSFATPDLAEGVTATFTAPSTPGRYEFTCTLHPEMTGTLIVTAGAVGSGSGDRTTEPTRARPTEPATTGAQRAPDGGSGKPTTERGSDGHDSDSSGTDDGRGDGH